MKISLVTVYVASALTLLLAPAAPPAPVRGWIVYWSENPWPSIWAVRPDGSHKHRILADRQNAKRPRLSPDRAWVAFDGTPPGKPTMSDFDIQLVRLDGTGLRTVTRGSAWDLDAQWSPDGRRLSFTRQPPSPQGCNTGAIWVIRRDGSDARRVAAGCDARWSPDGQLFVYTAPSGTELRTIAVAGGPSKTLLAAPDGVQAAGWSPDGKTVLFTRVRGYNGADAAVYRINVGGGDPRRLVDGVAGSWSPDGSQIVYTNTFSSPLVVADADGSHRRLVRGALGADPDWR